MKLITKETSDTQSFKGMPISYRVSLEVDRGTVTLHREYFRVGFSDGEQYDDFYFDNEWSGRQGNPISRCTFITKRIDDKEYLKQNENILIKGFYERCIKSRDLVKKRLATETKRLSDDINNYEDILNHFEYLNRGDKLKKLKNRLK